MNFGTRRAMERLADDQGHFRMLAVDQRPPVNDLVARALNVDSAPLEAVQEVKRLLVSTLAPLASAILVDPVTAFAASDLISPRQGMIMTLESSVFDARPDGRMTAPIDAWSVDKIKRIGADGVKFLAWYRGDAGHEVLEHQQRVVAEAGAACRRADIPFILELLLYPFPGESPDETPAGQRRTEMVIESVEAFAGAEYGVDLFKLESPISPQALADGEANGHSSRQAFSDLHHAAGRPWVLLSGGAESEAFLGMLSLAYAAGASGYLAGRSIWWEALQHYPDLQRVENGLRNEGSDYMRRVNDLTTAEAAPWVRAWEGSRRPAWNDVPVNYTGMLT